MSTTENTLVDGEHDGPLAGIRVVDFSAVVSGPLAAMWLADQGADVVKVETVDGGDMTRATTSAPDLHGLAGLFMNCNRGKRAISVDVGSEVGREIVLDLCRQSDVFIQNWRPGVVERLGLGYDDVAAVNPEIIYVSISGFGPDGPYAHRRVYDPIIQGIAGYVELQTNPEIPFPDLVRNIVCDKVTSLTAAQGICAALVARSTGRGGQHLHVPMLDASLSFLFPDGYMSKALRDDPHAEQRPRMSTVYRVSPTADGNIIYYTATMPDMFGLFRALGHPEWADDPRWSTAVELRKHREELGGLIAAAIELMTTAELSERLAAEDVPFAPVHDLDQVQLDPQVVHNEVLREREHPIAGRVIEARSPVRFSATPPGLTPLAPRFGEHTDAVLRQIGRSEDEIATLRSAGSVV